MAQLEQPIDVSKFAYFIISRIYFLQVAQRVDVIEITQTIVFYMKLNKTLTLSYEWKLANLLYLILVQNELAQVSQAF